MAVLFPVMGGLDPATLDPSDIDLLMSNPLILLPILAAMLLGIPLAMAMYFAPALVALERVPVMRSFALSFMGCLRNILPFLVYGLVALVLFVLGALPFLLGLLVVMPLLTIAIYTAYEDIFHG